MIKCKGMGKVSIPANSDTENEQTYIVVQHDRKHTAMLMANTYLIKKGFEAIKNGDKIYFEGVLDYLEADQPIIIVSRVSMVKRKKGN